MRRSRPTRLGLALALAAVLAGGCAIPDPSLNADTAADTTSADAAAPDALDAREPTPDTSTPLACTDDSDCAHIVGCCYYGACSSGTCVVRSVPDCCSTTGPCAVSTPLHAASCVEPCAAFGCQKELRLPEAGCGDELWRLALDPDGFAALTVTDLRPDRVTWHLSDRRGLAGGRSLYAGDVLCPTYHTGPLDSACRPVPPGADGAAVTLGVDTPPVLLPSDTPSVAELWLWLELEPSVGPGPEGAFDGLDLLLVDEGGVAYPRWSSRQHPHPHRTWFPVLVDLSDFAGRLVRVRLVFDTLDGRDNDYEGVYVGGLRFYTPCASHRGPCTDAPCALGRPTPVAPIADTLCAVAPADPGQICVPCDATTTCPTSDPCDVTSCVNGTCETSRELTAACCLPLPAWPGPASFEAPLDERWTVDPPALSGEPTWHLSDRRARTGAWSLRFGDPNEPRIAPPGASARGVIWSPPTVVPPDAPVWRFELWLATEFDGAPDPLNPAGLDLLEALVEVLVDAPISLPPAVVWDSRAVGGTTGGDWIPVEVDLSDLRGRTVRLGWRFDTADDAANDAEGVFLDDPWLGRVCPTDDDPTGTEHLAR